MSDWTTFNRFFCNPSIVIVDGDDGGKVSNFYLFNSLGTKMEKEFVLYY
jgi:hypothetical protein